MKAYKAALVNELKNGTLNALRRIKCLNKNIDSCSYEKTTFDELLSLRMVILNLDMAIDDINKKWINTFYRKYKKT